MKDNNDIRKQESDRPKRRRRLPVCARLMLDDSLDANEQHPLAQASPEMREASRLRLIAAVLARLASVAVEAGG